jgi:hypothetical protein
MKPGSERVALILIGVWAATIVVMFATSWLDFAKGDSWGGASFRHCLHPYEWSDRQVFVPTREVKIAAR